MTLVMKSVFDGIGLPRELYHYMDDIFLFSTKPSIGYHLDLLEKVLKGFQERGILLEIKKFKPLKKVKF